RYLFVPLAEAVVFALVASYFFSRTLVPTLVMYLMKKEAARHQHPEQQRRAGIFARIHHGFETGFEAIRQTYVNLANRILEKPRQTRCGAAFIVPSFPAFVCWVLTT